MSSFQSDCPFRQGFYSFYTRFKVPKLYSYVYKGKWHKIPSRCKNHPREAKFIHRYAPCDTALHRLLRPPGLCSPEYENFLSTTDPAMQDEIAQLRLKAVRALVKANPSIISTPDCFGRTPLHLACINVQYSKGTAELLLDACPAASLIQDTSGKTPLHYLLTEGQHVPSILIEEFVAAAPNTLTMADRKGRTPIDIAKLNGEQSDSLKKLLTSATTSETDLAIK